MKDVKTEIGGTFKWSYKQMTVYAEAFKEGDAVRAGGRWHKVVEDKEKNKVMGRTGNVDGNQFRLNHERYSNTTTGIFNGFTELVHANKYEIITPKDYEVQEGDKLVRLGKTVEQYGQSELTFGKVYEVVRWHEDGELVYKNDMTTALLASYLKEEDSAWGVIPRYENVKEEKDMDDKNEHSENTRTFKVGDMVKVSGTDSRFDGCIGKVDNVHETRGEFRYHAAFGDGDNCWIDANDLELVEEEKTKTEIEEVFEVDYSGKFKVGDRVKVIATAFEDSGGDIGKYGIVSSISERYKHFAPYLVEFDSGGDEHFNEAELELIERVEEKEEEEMNKKEECVGKFKEGDRVRVTGGYYNGWEGSISQSREVGGETACAVLFVNGRGYRWVEEELLELVEKVERSPEQQALDYLLSREENATRRILKGEVAIWAKIHLEHGDYDELRQATKILEKLEENKNEN